MHRLNIVANSAVRHLLDMAGWLAGCSHRRQSFPFTPRSVGGVRRQAGTETETCVVCLDCGRQMAYDWTLMRIALHRPAGVSLSTGRNS
jgi:hypothetical protein